MKLPSWSDDDSDDETLCIERSAALVLENDAKRFGRTVAVAAALLFAIFVCAFVLLLTGPRT